MACTVYPAAATASFTVTGQPGGSPGIVKLWRANPFTLSITLAAGAPSMAGIEKVVCEIVRDRSGAPPSLAAVEVTEGIADRATLTFPFTTLQTTLPLAGKQSQDFWMVVTALDVTGDRLFTLFVVRIEVHNPGDTGAPPDDPDTLTRWAADWLYQFVPRPYCDSAGRAYSSGDGVIYAGPPPSTFTF